MWKKHKVLTFLSNSRAPSDYQGNQSGKTIISGLCEPNVLIVGYVFSCLKKKLNWETAERVGWGGVSMKIQCIPKKNLLFFLQMQESKRWSTVANVVIDEESIHNFKTPSMVLSSKPVQSSVVQPYCITSGNRSKNYLPKKSQCITKIAYLFSPKWVSCPPSRVEILFSSTDTLKPYSGDRRDGGADGNHPSSAVRSPPKQAPWGGFQGGGWPTHLSVRPGRFPFRRPQTWGQQPRGEPRRPRCPLLKCRAQVCRRRSYQGTRF